jgi:hypothetical protein
LNIHSAVRRIILISTILLLIALAWTALSGGLGQLSRSQTIGQQAETAVQLACGFLSLLSAVTCFYLHRWRRRVRIAWAVSLTMTAGMSSLVWGPPMLTVGLAFAAGALLGALTIIWLLRVGGA